MKRVVFLLALAAAACDPEPVPRPGKRAGTRGDPFGAVETAPVTAAALGYRQARALVVGISRYSSPSLGALDGTVFDAEEVAALLASRYGMKTTLLTDRDGPPLTRARLLEALGDLKKDVGRDDALLFFYAGHGVPGRLVPADAEPAKDPAAWKNLLSFAELGAALRACDAHHTLVVLDSCFSGSALAEGSPLKEAVGTLGDPSLRVAEADNLARVFNRRSFQVITAGTGAEEVEDLAKLSRDYAGLGKDLEKHSPFTGVLLQALRGLTGRPDGRVPASDLGYYLKHTLVNENAAFKARQAPQFGALGGGDGDFLFLPAQRVLNPRLVAPLYMPGTEYAELRTSACAALAAFVLAGAPDREALAAAAVPHVARLLRDEKAEPRMAAARAVRALAPLAKDVERCLPLLTERLADAKTPDEEKDIVAEALGALAAAADKAAVDALHAYLERLRARFHERIAKEGLKVPPWPREFDRRYGTLQGAEPAPGSAPPLQLAYLEKFRAVEAWALHEGVEILRRDERRHQEGSALLERAEKAAAEKSVLDARRLAVEAEGLLRAGSAEETRARELPRALPEIRLHWRVAAPALHEGVIRELAASADGSRLATWGEEGKIRWWNARSGALEGELPVSVPRLAGLALSGDGRRLVWAAQSGEVQRWDLETGRTLSEFRMLRGVRGFAAIDDATVAVGMFEGIIGLLRFEEEEVKADYLRDAGGTVTHLALHRAKGLLVSYGNDGRLRVWDLAKKSLATEIPALPKDEQSLQSLAVHEERGEAVWACELGALCAAPLDGKAGPRILGNTEGGAYALAFSPDGKTLVLASARFGLHAARYPGLDGGWLNASTVAVEVGSFHRLSARSSLSSAPALFSPDGGRFWAGRGRGLASLDPATGKEGPEGALRGRIAHAAFSPDGRRIVSSGTRLLLWEGDAPRAIDHEGRPGVAAWIYPDGRHALVQLERELLCLELASDSVRWRRPASSETLARLSRDGSEVVVTGGPKVGVLDAATGALRREWETKHVTALALHPDGRTAALGGSEVKPTLALVDLQDGRELWRRQAGNAVFGGTSALAFDPHGLFLAAGDEGGQMSVWRVRTGEPVGALSAADLGHVRDLAFSPDGRLLVAAGDQVRVWDVTEKTDRLRFSPAAGGTLSASFSPDGRRLLTAGLDGSLSLWSLGLGIESVRLPAPPDGVNDVCVSPAGDVYATGRGEGLFICSARTGEILASLPGRAIEETTFSRDGRRVSSVGNGKLRVCEIEGAKLLLEVPAKCGRIAPDGERALALGHEEVKVLSLDGKELGSFRGLRGTSLLHAVFTHDGVVFGDDTGQLWRWTAASGECRAISPATGEGVFFLVASPDGRRVVSADLWGTSRLDDLGTGAKRRVGAVRRQALSNLEYAPDGLSLLYAWDDGVACVWDLEKDVARTWFRLDGGYPHLSWHPDGRRFFGTAIGWYAVHVFELADFGGPPPAPRPLARSLKDVDVPSPLPEENLEERLLRCRDLDAARLLAAGELAPPLRRLLERRLEAAGEALLQDGLTTAARARFTQANSTAFEATFKALEAIRAKRWGEAETLLEKAKGLDADRLFLLRTAAARGAKDAVREKALRSAYKLYNGRLPQIARALDGDKTPAEAVSAGAAMGEWPLESEGELRAWFALLGVEGHLEEARRLLKTESLPLELLRP